MITIIWEMADGYFIVRQGSSAKEAYKALNWRQKKRLNSGVTTISIVAVIESI
jgi:hypothetical protein